MKIKKFNENNISEDKMKSMISNLDELIKLQTEKLELLKKHKKGLIQHLNIKN